VEPVTVIRSTTVVLPATNIDTDQIIPARYLTMTSRGELGTALFADWRYDASGQPRPDFVLNQPQAQGSRILVAGRNFGCGSSREHAPWALHDWGFRAVISTEIADIFRGNSLKNGLLPIVVGEDTHRWLLAHPGAAVEIDLPGSCIRLPDGTAVPFSIESFARHCLVNGIDELGFLLAHGDAIERHERLAG
jgi:3-isopropylmalate/(R)-2-methylmalate dehydratase small subunit